MRWERTLLSGCLPFGVLVRDPPPPALACMPCSGSACCLGGRKLASPGFGPPPTPLSYMSWAGSARFSGGAPSYSSCFGVSPPPPSPECRALGEHAAARGGPPLLHSSGCARRMRATYFRCPLLPMRGLRTLLGREGPSPSCSWPCGGGCAAVFGGPSPIPGCAPWACAAGRAPPPLSPPLVAACIKRTRPFGG